MKSERHQGSALRGASIKLTDIRYNKCKNTDRSELLTKGLKVATGCTVSGVIFSEFQGAMTRSQEKMFTKIAVAISISSIRHSVFSFAMLSKRPS